MKSDYLISEGSMNETEQDVIGLTSLLSFWSVQNANHLINSLREQSGALHFHHIMLGLITLPPPVVTKIKS